MLSPLSQDDVAKIQNKIEICIICMMIFTNGTQKRTSQAIMGPNYLIRKKMLMILLSNTKKKARFFVLSLKIGDIQGS